MDVMPRDSGDDWRAQLEKLRGNVEEMERKRAEEERLRLERSRESLQERLRHDTPESLNHQIQDLRKDCDRAARRFYPVEGIEQGQAKVQDFAKRIQFYRECEGQFSDLFTPPVKLAIARCHEEIEKIRWGLDRQLRQWGEIRDVLGNVAFRTRLAGDDKGLVQAAKQFSEAAHGMGLAIPPDFFSTEGAGFHVVAHQEAVLGYIRHWPDQRVVTFAVVPPSKLNFPKFIRGVLYKAYRSGPLAATGSNSVRVRLGMTREVKFFTDLGFVRSETVSVSEWVYERSLD
jgi:hypothetical protein